MAISAIDNTVYVGNEARQSDCAELLAKEISAVVWDGNEGEIEYVGHKKPNEKITSFQPYQKYIDQAVPFPEPFVVIPPETREQYEEAQQALLDA